jgi:hypothetical protein
MAGADTSIMGGEFRVISLSVFSTKDISLHHSVTKPGRDALETMKKNR